MIEPGHYGQGRKRKPIKTQFPEMKIAKGMSKRVDDSLDREFGKQPRRTRKLNPLKDYFTS